MLESFSSLKQALRECVTYPFHRCCTSRASSAPDVGSASLSFSLFLWQFYFSADAPPVNDAFIKRVYTYFKTNLAGKKGMDFNDFKAAAPCVTTEFQLPLFVAVVIVLCCPV